MMGAIVKDKIMDHWESNGGKKYRMTSNGHKGKPVSVEEYKREESVQKCLLS